MNLPKNLQCLVFLIVTALAFSGCKNSNTYIGQSPTIDEKYTVITFEVSGGWADVTFTHELHSEYQNENCSDCHTHTDIREETNWNCRSCHSSQDVENLCGDDANGHDCMYVQCQLCHEDLSSDPTPNCLDCHVGGQTIVSTGQFMDSAVQGLTFRTDTLNGVTDSNGTFRYVDGENITFFVGNIQLGQGVAATSMTPVSLVAGALDETDPSVINICRFLQTLDLDGDPDNGITLSSPTIVLAGNFALSFDVDTITFENSTELQDLMDSLNSQGIFPNGSTRTLVSASEAQLHMRSTLEAIALQNNTPPFASSVSVSGGLFVGGTLSADYLYNDHDGDVESVTTFQWYRAESADDLNPEIISGATSAIYTPVVDDEGYHVLMTVTPVAATGVTQGNAVSSTAVGPVAPNNAPTATVYSISGPYCVNCQLTATYDYTDTEQDQEGDSTIQWYRADNAEGSGATVIAGETSLSYTPTDEDLGRYLGFEVVPAASSGTSPGEITRSLFAGPVDVDPSNAKPVAVNISITGSLRTGSRLYGSYDYSDAEDDPEGATTVQWYRYDDNLGNGEELIYGATSLTYQTTVADDTKYLKLEVTPVATIGGSPGTSAKSPSFGPIRPNSPPMATGVKILDYRNIPSTIPVSSFSPSINLTLTGYYVYSDEDGDNQDAVDTQYRWYRASNSLGAGATLISGAEHLSYTPVAADSGQYLIFEVIPAARTGDTIGSAYLSPTVGPTTNSITVYGAISAQSQIDHISFSLATGTNIVIDVLSWESCESGVITKSLPGDLFGNGNYNDRLNSGIFLFTSNGALVQGCGGMYTCEGPGAHDSRSGNNTYLTNSLSAGDYMLAIGARSLSEADAWGGANSSGDTWSATLWPSGMNYNQYKITFTFN